MKNLTKLTLSHNIIDKIENLDALIKLQELDLSFNRITKMENLNHLIKLEILILAGNKINEIENIDNLVNLKIFSIADNKIDKWDHVLYLRKFKYLRSVNMTGNPCTKKENYNDYLVAFLPQVIYFSYVLISEDKRNRCTQMHQQAIFKVEEEEAIIKNEMDQKLALEKKMANDSLCFVDQLDGDEFFELIFKYDEDGTVLKNINDETFTVFEEYKQKFSIVCHELYKFGIDQHSLRAKEHAEFNSVVEKARETVRDEARQTIETIKAERNEIFKKFDSLVAQSVDNQLSNEQDIKIDVKMIKAQELAKEFNESLSNMWTKLMYSQVVLHEQIEDIYEIFKINMTDLKDSFVEFVRKTFSQMRDILLEYRGAINVVINNYIASIGDESTMPLHLVNICGDVDILNNTLIASHDIHIQTIDNREDSTIERINLWLEELLNDFITQENLRHRQRILEISHFLQFQREQMHNHFYINDSFALDVAAALEG
ncbi:dynein regulatory complex subunit 3-like isoform X2 [Microplitis mediator]|nr:dynein regulatory complex subunit 3-like isoform X2 [Microplitis mediator]